MLATEGRGIAGAPPYRTMAGHAAAAGHRCFLDSQSVPMYVPASMNQWWWPVVRMNGQSRSYLGIEDLL